MKIFAFFVLIFVQKQAKSFDVNCKFQSTTWPHIGQHTQCFVESLNVTESSKFITNISGTYLAGQSKFDVKSVDIRGVCNYVPLGLTNFFPNLRGLQMYNCQLKSICSFDMVEFKNLVILELHYNQLTTLPSRLFQHNPNLKRIHFGNNRLKFIHENIFDDLPLLEETYFDNQICSGTKLSATTRYDVQYGVEKIILEKCQTPNIHEKCIDREIKLTQKLCNEEYPRVDEIKFTTQFM
jgi:Leucine-rich repeat (LRR) protein